MTCACSCQESLCNLFVISNRQVTAAMSTKNLKKITKSASNYSIIGIDEGQFVSRAILSNSYFYFVYLYSFQTLLSFVRIWQMQGRQSLWLLWMGPFKDRYQYLILFGVLSTLYLISVSAGFWSSTESDPTGGECSEAESCMYGMLPGRSIHKETRLRKGGVYTIN